MNSYSDLQGTDTNLTLSIDYELIGNPDYTIKINDIIVDNNTIINKQLSMLNPIVVKIELRNKIYTSDFETAVIVKNLSINDINIIPTYTQLVNYDNDHGFVSPTNYLGFNGKWTLTIDRPFYQWLHQAQGQGWLLT
jgi:hypothetical protein